MNPRRLADSSVLMFSDVLIALAVWGVAALVRASWHTATIVGVLPTSTLAGVIPVTVWVMLRAVLGLYPGYGINAVDELRRESYATLGALIIASTFLGLHQGQDVSRSVLIGGFLVLLIAAPLVRQVVKWSLKKARLWGNRVTTDSRQGRSGLPENVRGRGYPRREEPRPAGRWPILVAPTATQTYPVSRRSYPRLYRRHRTWR